MKHFVITFWLLLLSVASFAQQELDFATKFMELNKANFNELRCCTVSPYMMERIMKLDTLEGNNNIRNILAQLKSIQIVEAHNSNNCDSLFVLATNLAKENKRRYKLYANEEEKKVYLRKRNKVIVEMVLISNPDNELNIVSITGNMDDGFIKELTDM